MELSIIVPVYNMAANQKLNHCMDSLVGQTIKNYEIIAVDDASDDTSLEILLEYERCFPEKVRVISYRPNRRQGGAKNAGLKAARGKWVGFIDSDDWVTCDYYQRLLQKADETGADLVGCDYSLVTCHTMETGRIVSSNKQEQTGVLDYEKHKSLLLRPGSMVLKIYKRKILQENGLWFPEQIFYEDNCAGSLWSLYFTHFEYIEEPLYYYYQHPKSTVHCITEEKCRDRMKAAALFYEECKNRGFLEQFREEIEYRFSELYYVITLFSYLSGVKHPKLLFIKELRRGIIERFPDFEKNTYYRKLTGLEEQQLIALQGKSDILFLWHYKLKRTIRLLRKKLRIKHTV